MDNEIHIVGIGASAGGLEAITELFDNLPNDTGFAFVIVQHLAPDFDSLMTNLLSTHTAMPIQVVKERTQVKRNSIYLIDKEHNLIIERNTLVPSTRNRSGTVNLPVDEFFHSLGPNNKKCAVGIVLSGTGSDGSRGIRSIKEHGGLILVQDPASCQFDGMPKSALDTGLVDKSLTPKELANMLNSLANKQSYIPGIVGVSEEVTEQLMQAIFTEIFNRTKVDFSLYRRSTIGRRLEKRLFLTQKDKLEDYLAYLKETPEEVTVLYNEFLIGVTSFFRDADAFELLKTKVIPQLFTEKTPQEPVRIWVPACSTGEEAYSLGILIEEYLQRHNLTHTYKIFATDLNVNAIPVANHGIYSILPGKDMDAALVNRYFTRVHDQHYKVSKKLRDNLVFTVHDVLNDPPFINMDLISCRNFLIYLNSNVQQEVLASFQFSLNYKGFLFLGPSENLGKQRASFESVNEHWNIFRNQVKGKFNSTHQLRANRRRHALPGAAARELGFAKKMESSSSQRHSTDGFHKMLLQRYVPMCMIVDENLQLLYVNGDLGEILTFPNSPTEFELEKMMGAEEFYMLKNGVERAKEEGQAILYKNVPFKKNKNLFKLDLAFEPLGNATANENLFLVEIILKDKPAPGQSPVVVTDEQTRFEQQFRTLELELKKTKDEKQDLNERLETTNEELQSSNEELMASNEELQSTNEELQSVNEELFTVNTELQAKVTELRLANSDMDNLLRSSEIGTLFVDNDMKIRRFTPSMAHHFQLMETDIGRPITSFRHTIGGVDIFKEMKKVLSTNEKVEREVTDADGNTFLMRIFPYLLNQKIEGTIATFVDIHGMKSAAQKMELMAREFKAIFDNTSALIYLMDMEGKILDVNQEVAGYQPSQLIGRPIFEVIAKEDQPKFREIFEKLKKSDEPIQWESFLQFVNGKKYFFKSIFVPIMGDNGKVQRIVVKSRDETHLWEIEKDVQTKARIFSEIYQYARLHVIILDPTAKILDVNYTDAGFKKEEILGKNLVDVSMPEVQDLVAKKIIEVRKGAASVEFETDFVAPNGEHRHYRNNIVALRQDNKLEGMVQLVQDVTKVYNREIKLREEFKSLEDSMEISAVELQKKNKELETFNSFMDSFVHGAAHDLRSPLTQVKGFLELLPQISDTTERLEIYQELSNALFRMERVLNGLIELIDFQKTKDPLPRQLNLKRKVQQVMGDIQPYLNKADGKIELDIPSELQLVYIEAYLQSIIYNLLHNAIKYRSYDRPLLIEIKGRLEDGMAVLTVKDNGIGIDLRRYGHFLFQPFKRLTVEREGTGIGLSIINGVVVKNGGRIEVSSELNKGTLFTVYLQPYADNPS